jgi:hypothetical protein
MKHVLILTLTFLGYQILYAQNPMRPKPAYCDQPTDYNYKPKDAKKPLPDFQTQTQLEYKVQVAVLRNTDPRNFHFHKSLVARYQPCEEIWIVESRQSFANRFDADRMRQELIRLGYPDPYITTLVTYQ